MSLNIEKAFGIQQRRLEAILGAFARVGAKWSLSEYIFLWNPNFYPLQ